jgi:ABC-type polysaccharide/polyol phosphate export permease
VAVATRSGGSSLTPRSDNLWAYRNLISNFARRDLKARFKGTTIGWAWSLLVPAATVAIYTVVFATIFRATPPDFGNGRAGVFAVWFVVGLVPWSLFSGGITAGLPSLVGSGALLQKVYIPSFVPVLGTMGAVTVQSLIEFGLVAAILLLFGNIAWTWLLVPLWLALFVIFTAALAYAVAVLNVFFRDLSQIVAVGLQLLFFATPIIYPIELIPADSDLPLRQVIAANPLSQFVLGFRDLMYGLGVPSLKSTGYVCLWTLGALGVAYLVFRWRGRDVGEEL